MKKHDCDFLTFLRNHENGNLVSFHMPGAKRGNFFNDVFRRLSLENFLGFDITEIQGADNPVSYTHLTLPTTSRV